MTEEEQGPDRLDRAVALVENPSIVCMLDEKERATADLTATTYEESFPQECEDNRRAVPQTEVDEGRAQRKEEEERKDNHRWVIEEGEDDMQESGMNAQSLNAHCWEFNDYQWAQINEDKTNKEIANALVEQGRNISARQGEEEVERSESIDQLSIDSMSQIYKYERQAVLFKMEKGQVEYSEWIRKSSAPSKNYSFTSSFVGSADTALETWPVTEWLVRQPSLFWRTGVAQTSHPHSACFPAFQSPQGIKIPVKNCKSRAFKIRWENDLKLACKDVEKMTFSANNERKFGMSANTTFHFGMSQLVYFTFWAAHIINSIQNIYREIGRRDVGNKEILDCLISLQKALDLHRTLCPPSLITDAEHMLATLNRLAETKFNGLTEVCEKYPELIKGSTFDLFSPRANKLYTEQIQVLRILHQKVVENKPCLVFYKVPPSGGKTILSIAVASMLSSMPGNAKRVLYICYNTLVRISVSTACEQAGVPFWVASTRESTDQTGRIAKKYTEGKASTERRERSKYRHSMTTSFSCRDMSKAGKARVTENTKKHSGMNRLGNLRDVWENAEFESVECGRSRRPTMIISDIRSAYELLGMFPDEFIVYMDEPTAGAENGMSGNELQQWVAKLCTRLPGKQAVLLSATLPSIDEMPTLCNLVGRETCIAVNNQRLPVGAVAIHPDGRQMLPHELAENWTEFVEIVRSLSNDSLMQRFYTPGAVHAMSLCVSSFFEGRLPVEYEFEHTIPTIGHLSHETVRRYAITLLTWIANDSGIDAVEGERLLAVLKGIVHNVPKPISSESFITDHVNLEGRALAVTTSIRAGLERNDGMESLEDLITRALSPIADKIPSDVLEFVEIYEESVKQFERKRDAFKKAGDMINYEELVRKGPPEFNWPITLAGFSASLSRHELTALGDIGGELRSGIGRYNPHDPLISQLAQSVVMREATNGRLACLFSTPDIVYGTNMTLITVFIGEAYGRSATRNSLYQLIGRAGRTGRADRAKILFQDEYSMRKAMLPEHLTNPSRSGVGSYEARVMDKHLDQALSPPKDCLTLCMDGFSDEPFVEEDVIAYFDEAMGDISQDGAGIVEVDIPRRSEGQHKNFCFVRFVSRETLYKAVKATYCKVFKSAAHRATDESQGVIVFKSYMDTPPVGWSCIKLSNLDRQTTEADIIHFFGFRGRHRGVGSIEIINKNRSGMDVPKNEVLLPAVASQARSDQAFIQFSSIRDAMQAMTCNGNVLNDRVVFLNYERRKVRVSPSGGSMRDPDEILQSPLIYKGPTISVDEAGRAVLPPSFCIGQSLENYPEFTVAVLKDDAGHRLYYEGSPAVVLRKIGANGFDSLVRQGVFQKQTVEKDYTEIEENRRLLCRFI